MLIILFRRYNTKKHMSIYLRAKMTPYALSSQRARPRRHRFSRAYLRSADTLFKLPASRRVYFSRREEDYYDDDRRCAARSVAADYLLHAWGAPLLPALHYLPVAGPAHEMPMSLLEDAAAQASSYVALTDAPADAGFRRYASNAAFGLLIALPSHPDFLRRQFYDSAHEL